MELRKLEPTSELHSSITELIDTCGANKHVLRLCASAPFPIPFPTIPTYATSLYCAP